MENLDKISYQELLTIYKNLNEFIKFLDKEIIDNTEGDETHE